MRDGLLLVAAGVVAKLHGDMQPVILELALNGETPKTRNPHAPRSPAEIASDAIDCLNAGASMIHNHSDAFHLTGADSAQRYGEAWDAIRAVHPDAILCPTTASGATDAEKIAHFVPCAERGARMAPIDPGSMNMPIAGGAEARSFSYINTPERIAMILETMAKAGLGPSIGIYEPGFLRTTVALQRAGKLPPGSFVKLYFFGGANYHDGKPCTGFGLDPTPAALEAYLEIIADTGLPWAAAVVGGCVFRSGMARLALQKGGHIRFGLEDHAGDRSPCNRELLDELTDLCHALNRRPASGTEAATMLGLPEPARGSPVKMDARHDR